MSRVPYTIEQLKKLGLVENNGVYVTVKSLVAKGKISKIDLTSHSIAPYKREDEVWIKPKVNQKVRNATKIEENGLKFDSRLEKYLYDLLKGAQIDFEFQKVYILQEKFRYGLEAVRAITLTVDFFIPSKNMICDTKGWSNDVSPLKYKMLKNLLWAECNGLNLPKIEMPRNKSECDLLLNKILYDYT